MWALEAPPGGGCVVAWGGCAPEPAGAHLEPEPASECWRNLKSHRDMVCTGIKARPDRASAGRVRVRSTLAVLARYGSRSGLLKGRPPLADVRSGHPPGPVAGRPRGLSRFNVA